MMRHFPALLAVFAIIVVGFTHAGEKATNFEAKKTLTKDDPKDAQRGGPMHVHTVPLKSGKIYTIEMQSTAFDSYLRLLDPKGNQLDEDDDSGGDLNSKIVFNCTKDGDYKIVTTTFGAGAAGMYRLTVVTAGAVQPAATAHKQMVDKQAPGFTADFAINGKPGKLADFKGKVVALYFFDVRSSACVSFLKNLNDWDAAHKKDGLTVVGVTYYPSDIGQKIGFDKEGGKITTVTKADKKSDQDVFRAFAEQNKVTHPLLALSKAEALAAFDAYVVNGVPQIVLIDRKGVISPRRAAERSDARRG